MCQEKILDRLFPLCYLTLAAQKRTGSRPERAMDRLGEYSLLYDFYGPLLTEKQRRIYEEVRFGDLSLSEASELFGVSRQGVHDTVHRVEEALDRYEEKLGLVKQFHGLREKAGGIRKICEGIENVLGKTDEITEILRLVGEIEEI